MHAATRAGWLVGAATLLFIASARAEPRKHAFVPRIATGDRVERTIARETKTRIAEQTSSETVRRETIDAWISVAATSPAERLVVEHPRATARTARGADLAGAPTPLAMHGATLRCEFAQGAWKATPVAGPTPDALLRFAAHGVDPLRRPLLPSAPLAIGETAQLAGANVHATLRHVLPIDLLSTDGMSLRLEAVEEKGDASVAHLRGTVRCRAKLAVPPYGDLETNLELDVLEDVTLADGLLRSLAVRGRAIAFATAGGASERVDVFIDATETATKRGADWKPARPADAWVPPATIEPEFDDRAWSVEHHRLADAKTVLAVTEWLLPGETLVDGTEDGWTEMVAVHRLPSSGAPGAVASLYDAKRREVVRAAPNAAWKIVRQSDDEVVYEWTLKGDKRFKDQHELGRIARGGDGLLQIRYVKKVARLPDADRSAWLARLAAAKVVGSR